MHSLIPISFFFSPSPFASAHSRSSVVSSCNPVMKCPPWSVSSKRQTLRSVSITIRSICCVPASNFWKGHSRISRQRLFISATLQESIAKAHRVPCSACHTALLPHPATNVFFVDTPPASFASHRKKPVEKTGFSVAHGRGSGFTFSSYSGSSYFGSFSRYFSYSLWFHGASSIVFSEYPSVR